jgi:multicomponent K+:H+ antiporter subunit E
MKRLLPSPWLSVGLFGGWLLLSRSLGAGSLLLGVLVAVVLPLLFTGLRPTPGRLRHPFKLARLILRVGGDVLRSAVDVAAGIVRSRSKPPKGPFVRVPLELRDPHALAALAMISAVIPGTVWSELSGDGSWLLVHVFDLDDEASFIAQFKRDYEHPLKEIFE